MVAPVMIFFLMGLLCVFKSAAWADGFSVPWLWLLMACVLLEVEGEGEEKKKRLLESSGNMNMKKK